MDSKPKLRMTVTFLTVAQITSGIFSTCKAANQADLQAAVLKANVLNGENFSVLVSGSNAAVSTFLRAKDDERNCRMKSVLLSKAIMDKAKDITVVRCTFYDRANQNTFLSLEVHAGDVRSFGNGAISVDQLLSSLPVTKGSGVAPTQSQAAGQSHSSTASDGLPEIQGDMNVDERRTNLKTLRYLKQYNLVDLRSATAEWKKEEDLAEKKNFTGWFAQHNALTFHLNNLVDEHNKLAKTHTMPSKSPIEGSNYQEQRMTILALIQKKKDAGLDTSAYETRFNAIQQLASDNTKGTAVKAAIDQLLQALR